MLLSNEKLIYPQKLCVISAPNGISANFANLKCCMPNGIPMMVIQNMTPKSKWNNISTNPPSKIQITLSINLPTPPPYITSLPKGQRANPASLKACRPMGMPMIVIQQITPAISQLTAMHKPPNMSQIRFPSICKKPHPCLLLTYRAEKSPTSLRWLDESAQYFVVI